MIDITITYDNDDDREIGRQLVNELEHRLGDYPASVWMERWDDR